MSDFLDEAVGDVVAAARSLADEAEKAIRATEEAGAAALAAVRAEAAVAAAEAAGREAGLQAEVRRLQALLDGKPEPDPEPVRRAPLLGSCATAGGFSAASVTSAVRRWAPGLAVRLFADEDAGLAPAPARGEAGVLLASWKPRVSAPLDEAAAVRAVSTLRAGDLYGFWHEPDVKNRNNGTPVAPMKKIAKAGHELLRAERPELSSFATLSGWTFDPTQRYNPLDYIDLGAFDVLALDLDGIAGYKDYRPVVEKALAWMEANGVTRWTVAEYGVKLRSGFSSAQRLSWLREQTDWLLALGDRAPEHICLFEVNTTAAAAYQLDAAEASLWRSYVVSSVVAQD